MDMFDKIAVNIKNIPKIIAKTMADEYLNDVRETFVTENEGNWKELSDWRIAQRGDGGHPILEDTGKLLNSIQEEEIGEGKYHVATNDPKAGIHEFGGTNEKGFVVPERSFMRSTYIRNYDKYQKLAEAKVKDIMTK